jgi:hypothetical protein
MTIRILLQYCTLLSDLTHRCLLFVQAWRLLPLLVDYRTENPEAIRPYFVPPMSFHKVNSQLYSYPFYYSEVA